MCEKLRRYCEIVTAMKGTTIKPGTGGKSTVLTPERKQKIVRMSKIFTAESIAERMHMNVGSVRRVLEHSVEH